MGKLKREEMISPIIMSSLIMLFTVVCPADDNSWAQSEKNKEFRIIEAFIFDDPARNLSEIQKINDLCGWISRYEDELHIERQIPQGLITYFFQRHFHFGEITFAKMKVLNYLLLHLNCPEKRSTLGREAALVFEEHTDIFVKSLENEEEWKRIIERISIDWNRLLGVVEKLGPTSFENDIREYVKALKIEREKTRVVVKNFMEEPVREYENITKVNNICYWIDDCVRDQRGISGELREDLFDVLLDKLTRDINEKKIEILDYLIINCYDGYYSEVLADKGGKIFKDYPQMFIKVLERTDKWEKAVDHLSAVAWEDFSKGLKKLGNSRFEKRIKEYIAYKMKERKGYT
jgi:hypothetical protein